MKKPFARGSTASDKPLNKAAQVKTPAQNGMKTSRFTKKISGMKICPTTMMVPKVRITGREVVR